MGLTHTMVFWQDSITPLFVEMGVFQENDPVDAAVTVPPLLHVSRLDRSMQGISISRIMMNVAATTEQAHAAGIG
jgi:hypothetical protein